MMLALNVGRVTENGIGSIVVVHGTKDLEWQLNTFDRTRIVNRDTIFETINGYLATLDEETHAKIFEVYEDIFDYIENSRAEISGILNTLKTQTRTLIDLIDLDKLEHYCKFSANFSYPLTLKDQYSPTEPRESTYLRSDYHGLLYLSTALKVILPIWGELIKRTQNEVGATFKEMVSVTIIGHSRLFSRPEMVRLQEYVNEMARKSKVPETAIHNSIGTQQLPDWLLGQVLIRRVAISETSIDSINLISNIYNFLTNSIEKLDSRFSTKVREKRSKVSTDDPDNTSYEEMRKIKQNVADNYTVGYEYQLENPHFLLERIMPKTDHTKLIELFERCIAKLNAENDLEITEWRLQLCGMIVGRPISSRALKSLSMPKLLVVMAITQAVIYTIGFEDIGHLLTAKFKYTPMNVVVGDGTSGNKRSRITPDNKEQLINIYRHYAIEAASQMNGNSWVERVPGIIIIDHINKETLPLEWYLNSPIPPSNERYKNGHRWYIPENIKNELARLIIEVKGKGVLDAHV